MEHAPKTESRPDDFVSASQPDHQTCVDFDPIMGNKLSLDPFNLLEDTVVNLPLTMLKYIEDMNSDSTLFPPPNGAEENLLDQAFVGL